MAWPVSCAYARGRAMLMPAPAQPGTPHGRGTCMYRKLMALLLGLAAALGIALVAPAGAANASDCDLNGTVCGRIRNWDATGDALWVTIAWGQNGSGRTLYAGQQSW